MALNRQLKEAHFVCQKGERIDHQDDGTFLTSRWVMNPALVHEGLIFALHENRSTPSYLQGKVLKLIQIHDDRMASGRRQRRVELLVQRTESALPWKAEGAGEKGYVWK